MDELFFEEWLLLRNTCTYYVAVSSTSMAKCWHSSFIIKMYIYLHDLQRRRQILFSRGFVAGGQKLIDSKKKKKKRKKDEKKD